MDNRKFFDCVKVKLFKGSFTQSQVDGINAIMAACSDQGVKDGRMVAYALATPMVETGGSFETSSENLNYSSQALVSKFGKRITQAQANAYGRNSSHAANQPMIANIIYGGEWGKTNLGNTGPNDGWFYRGRGLTQITGKRNYALLGEKLGLDLVGNPDLAKQLTVAANIMVVGMRDGLFTGREFSDYFNDKTDWVNARRMINALDRADDIANDAKKFYECMKAAA